MSNTHDIIIIGAGSGGLNVAGFFSKLKLKVLLVDKSDTLIGGDCLNTGCVPSKALIHVANQFYDGVLSTRFLQSDADRKIDIRKITEYIREKQEKIRAHENKDYLINKGIEFASGEAKFLDSRTVTVNNISYRAKNIILATGSRPKKLSVENDKSVREFDNETIFSIDYLPQQFVFIGGGPICCELGQAFQRLGSKVTIINGGPRILEKEIVSASMLVEETFRKEGMNIINNATLVKIAERKVYYKTSATGEAQSVDADAIFVGIGRDINIDGLDIEKAGIRKNETNTKLLVNDYLQTTNKRVYVVGDVAGNFQFTHAAEMHAKTVIRNLLSWRKKKFDATNIAWTTFTTPEVATFGMSEKDALRTGTEIICQHFTHDDRAIVDENENGMLQLYVDTKGRIRGGTMVAKNAGELSQELILAMNEKIPLSSLFNKVYPYPTGARINKTVASMYESRRLNSFTIKLLRFLYSIS